ncbi:MAG: tetratricopeptide repeat protein [Candidatus Omnitrophota bacterium]
MKKTIFLAAAFVFFAAASAAAVEKKAGPNQLFYAANQSYESRDYVKAAEGYIAVLDSGLESGSLYYNLGNSFLKMGKLGHAILCYERAKRMIPHDSDLKANLAYARSLVESASSAPEGNFILKAINAVFEPYSLRAVIFSATVLYIILLVIGAVFTVKPFLARRLRALPALVAALLVLNVTALASRYLNERILKHGVVIQKEVECKYEPIEKSTTYYKLREGERVLILNTRSGWRQIKRPDEKISWVKEDAVEPI